MSFTAFDSAREWLGLKIHGCRDEIVTMVPAVVRLKKFPEKSVDIFSPVLIKSKLLRKMPGKNKGNKKC